jgi:lipopolysaccharide cholinephosphotransferase
MKNDLREIQLFQLQMLKDIADICEKNHIKYSLSDGSLLGAVRHKGFIPWDDDIDIMMEWTEYLRFLKIAPAELGEKYFLQNKNTDKEYWLSWSKIRANNTTSMPKDSMEWNIHWGICIDIFPVIGIKKENKEKQLKRLSKNKLLLMDKYLKATNTQISNKLKLLYAVPYKIRRFIYKLIERKNIISLKETDWCCQMCRLDRLYPTSIFSEYKMIRFEDRDFMVIKDCEEYLRIQYGDYMKLPPENERIGHALSLGSIIWDTRKSYGDYKKELLK